ncbi:MAG: hypothetical protein Q9P01_04710 [Anaerolineae bacterium]|nr:hypothetical protein [Anaerolineae bacterium]MDQ7034143.1 hypothetical protein [Anaerolineae bacterium]
MRLRWLWMIFMLLMPLTSIAQDDPAILALRADTTDLQTGEFYPVRIEIDNVSDLWSVTMQIAYDPQMLYIVGTDSGSPIELGDFLSDGGLIIQNSVREQDGFVRYTPSRIAPADPVSGNGVIGTFLVFPLQAGEVTLSFLDADMSRIIFSTNEEGLRTVQESVSIPFAVTQLTFTITGEIVTPPPEATATPTPSVTPIAPQNTDEPTFTPEPTLVVVTDSATINTPTPVATPDISSDTESTTSTLLYVAIGAVLVAALGLVIVLIVMRRGRSKA